MGETGPADDDTAAPKLSFGRLLMSIPVDISDLVERDQTPMREVIFDFPVDEDSAKS